MTCSTNASDQQNSVNQSFSNYDWITLMSIQKSEFDLHSFYFRKKIVIKLKSTLALLVCEHRWIHVFWIKSHVCWFQIEN